ncbi:MAG: 3-hydroxybutyryl-CoA dehydratase [Candidatus Woesearchaeota archaeon]|jgi:3-hydroxybutyryl-CoA dehydratase
MDCIDRNYEDVEIGDVFSFERTITREDVMAFAKLTGDKNPLHTDAEYAKEKGFVDQVVHGMLSASLFSTLVGMLCPGKRSLYLSQDTKFKMPIIVEDKVVVQGEITRKINAFSMLEIKTSIQKEDIVCVEGLTRVKFI